MLNVVNFLAKLKNVRNQLLKVRLCRI